MAVTRLEGSVPAGSRFRRLTIPGADVRVLTRLPLWWNVRPMCASEAKKVALVSRSGYYRSRDATLRSLIARKVELFCAVGQDCREWEDAMDSLVVGPDGSCDWHVTTSSHPDESIAEVIAFAKSWASDVSDAVEVIEV